MLNQIDVVEIVENCCKLGNFNDQALPPWRDTKSVIFDSGEQFVNQITYFIPQ